MDTLVTQQLAREAQSLELGIERYMAAYEKDVGRGILGAPADRVLRKAMHEATVAVEQLQAECLASQEATWGGRKGQPQVWRLMPLSLEAEVIAYIAMRSVLTANSQDKHVLKVGMSIAGRLEEQLWLTEVPVLERRAAKERDYEPANRVRYLKEQLKKYGARTIRRWKRRLEDLPTTKWSNSDRLHIGGAVLEAILPAISPFVAVREPYHQPKSLSVKSSFVEALMEEAGNIALLHPFYSPMVCPPEAWDNSGHVLKGGYLRLRADGLKTYTGEQTDPQDLSEQHLDGLNVAQATPWKVNEHMLMVAQRAFHSDIGPLPYEPEMAIPGRVKDDLWSAMDKEQQKNHTAKVARAHDHNFRNHEAKMAHARALEVADRFKQYDNIWFPHAMDWRGRMYPIPQDLHPQGHDLVKSLLMFGEGKALGQRGLEWLEYQAANTYGLDKEDRSTQSIWCATHWDRIMLVGEDPWLDLEFWSKAEEPWQFGAVCRELYEASQLDDPGSYLSRIPVAIDGSCNGIQHLSAMGLDEEGGRNVNLLPGPRQDIYQVVADKVSALIPEDSPWYSKVTRKTVKRAVMTTPYGVTPLGMSKQLRDEGFCDGHEDELKSANYLRDKTLEALGDTLTGAMETMQWFRDCAQLLAKDNVGMAWETPVHSVISMAYMHPKMTQVDTGFGRVVVTNGPTVRLNKNRQVKGVTPNIIHSFDAAHMIMVLTSFNGMVSVVHDSYGTHACDVDDLLMVTKQRFVDMYSENWLEKLRAHLTFLTGVHLPAPPARGTLDITQVLKSDYFFA